VGGRGGSRVVQVICRNHSNVSKPAFVISQVLYCSSRNQLSFLFVVYYVIKQRKKRGISLLRRKHCKPSPSRANSTSLRSRAFVLCRYFREQGEKIRRHDRRKFVRSGWDSVVYGSLYKSLKTLFDWPETLPLSCELLKLGCDWLSRRQTTVETTDNREASPRKSLRLFLFRLEFIVNLLRRKTGLWFEVIQFVGRRTVLSTMLAWFSRKSAHIRTRTSSGS